MSKSEGHKTFVVSTRSGKQNVELAQFHETKIFRFGLSGKYLNKAVRYATYVYYNVFATLLLAFLRPSKLIYFESLSSYPAYVYKKYINRNAKIFIHYHEYTSIEEYAKGMITTQYFHRLEKKLYPEVAWLSHTNDVRMQLFLEDIAPLKVSSTHILPNYPPLSWNSVRKNGKNTPLRLIYVGSLGMKSMFVKEFTKWVVGLNGKVIWDIYSINGDNDVLEYFDAFRSPNINFKAGVSYEELPAILRQYDVGVILYNGHIPNYVHVAPNKLFEYLACGLDVWFPNVIKGTLQYISLDCSPKVVPLDFNNLEEIDLVDLKRQPNRKCPNNYFAEVALKPLLERLKD
ncbi:MAG TPA: hypothetical protein PL009_00310 [Flavipsychrobacter sp.]|nr:hypothetical protein [Flavipsychrobacter sp.]